MARSAAELRKALANARSNPLTPLGNKPSDMAEARRARHDAIQDLKNQLAQRESEEAGSWQGQHPQP